MENKRKLGNELFKDGKLAEAISVYSLATEETNVSTEEKLLLFSNRGICYFKLGDFAKAQLDFKKCLEINAKALKVR